MKSNEMKSIEITVRVIADVYHNYNEVVQPILQLFSIITSQLPCYLSQVSVFCDVYCRCLLVGIWMKWFQ